MAGKDVRCNLFILQLLSRGRHVVSESLHLTEEFCNGGGTLLRSGQGHARVDDAAEGL